MKQAGKTFAEWSDFLGLEHVHFLLLRQYMRLRSTLEATAIHTVVLSKRQYASGSTITIVSRVAACSNRVSTYRQLPTPNT